MTKRVFLGLALAVIVLCAATSWSQDRDYVCGDVNGDGEFYQAMIDDIAYMLAYVLDGGPPPVEYAAGNLAGCGGANILDLVHMIEAAWSQFPPDYNCDQFDPCTPQIVGSLTIDRVGGMAALDSIPTGQEIAFHLRMTVDVDEWIRINGVTNGFQIYSPTGAEWNSSRIDTTSVFNASCGLDLARKLISFSATGEGADTLGIGAATLYMGGLRDGFDEITHVITIGPIDRSYAGHEICIDSSWFSPEGDWLWAPGMYGPPMAPSWGGPYCFTVFDCCDLRGDIDRNGTLDIADLVFLVDFMWLGGAEPACFELADINGDGQRADIADLVHFVNYMFLDGPDPVPCP